jgi:hypothetical protein
MRFVDDDQIEVADAEPALAVIRLVNEPHHRRVSRYIDPALGIFLRNQIDGRGVGKKPFESIDRLSHQRHTISKEQHSLRPIAAHQQFTQRDHRPRFTRARRHRQQRLAIQVALEGFTDSPYRPRLIIPFDNGLIDFNVGESLTSGTSLNKQFQLRFFVEPLYSPRRIARVVPNPMVVAVGVEDDRPLAKLFLQTVGVQLRLLLTDT